MRTDESLRGRRVTVMGLGRFGGQIAVIQHLGALGCELIVTDAKDEDSLADSLDQIRPLIDSGQAELRLGSHNVSDFTTVDLIVVSPAVPHPWDNRFLRSAEAAAIPITTEIAMTAARLPKGVRVIGITGSAGKSTTSAMTAHILRSCAPDRATHLGGNISQPLLTQAASLAPDDLVVLELSSFQLHWLAQEQDLGFTLDAAVFTNYAPNHLDWHLDESHYFDTKRSIADDSSAPLIVSDPELLSRLQSEGTDAVLCEDLDEPLDLPVPGTHNARNARTAIAGARMLLPELSVEQAAESLRTYASLPHRLQPVPTTNPMIRAFNDSKSTTPEATAKAIASFADPSEILLIAGGYDKQADLAPMLDAARECAGVFTIGTTGAEIMESLGTAMHAETIERAVDLAMEQAGVRAAQEKASIILLSPGCASWDQFETFEERGDRFIELMTS